MGREVEPRVQHALLSESSDHEVARGRRQGVAGQQRFVLGERGREPRETGARGIGQHRACGRFVAAASAQLGEHQLGKWLTAIPHDPELLGGAQHRLVGVIVVDAESIVQ